MSMGYRGKTTNAPRENTAAQAQAERESVMGEMPGKIVSFDPNAQTARVQPLYKPRFNGQPVSMPVLEEVPVRFARAGGGAITQPVKAGDRVTLRPQMRSQDNYHSDDDGAANDARSFHLSDMEAHVAGGESLKDPIQNFDAQNLHIRSNESGTHGIRISPEGKFKIEGSRGDVFSLLEQVVRLEAEGFTKLGTEALVHAPRYAQIGEELYVIADKLLEMKI